MASNPYIAEAAALIGDPARANMLVALMDGRALTATELGLVAGVAPSTASEHLAKLAQGQLVTVLPRGRHRFYRLGSRNVAKTIESLMVLATEGPKRFRPRSRCDDATAHARTCYDHFAGSLGVGISDRMVERNLVVLDDDGGLVTDKGQGFLCQIGIAAQPSKGSRRAFCRPCLDWSERRWHIGGSLGASIARRSFELGWTERQANSRAVLITPIGQKAFAELFGLRL